MFKKITLSMAFGAATLFGVAAAAPVTINGMTFDDPTDFATGIDVRTGDVTVYDVAGNNTDANVAVGADLTDGVRCAGDDDACSFNVLFDQGVANGSGDDFAIYTLGVGAPELFDIAINGVRISNLSSVATGLFVGNFELGELKLDLSAFGIAAGATINAIKVIVNQGQNSEEFSAFARINAPVETPLPAAFLLFLGGAAGLFGAGRKKKAA